MNYTMVLAGIIALVVVVLLFKVVKNAVKLAMLLFFITMLAVGVFSFFFVRDGVDVVNDLSSEDSVFLFTKDDEIVAGLTRENNETVLIEENDLEEYRGYYEEENYDELLGENQRLLILEVVEPEEDNETGILDKLGDKIPQLNFSQEIADFPDEKSASVITQLIENMKQDPLYMIKAYKEGNMLVYPESFVFKTLRLIFDRPEPE